MVSRRRLPLPTDRYCHSVPKFQPPELLLEEQLGRLLMVRRPKLGSYGMSADPFRSARTGGVDAPFFRRCRPHIRVKVGRPFPRVRARVRYFPFFSFTSSPVWRKVLSNSSISVKVLSIGVHAFASSREEAP